MAKPLSDYTKAELKKMLMNNVEMAERHPEKKEDAVRNILAVVAEAKKRMEAEK